MIPGAGWVAKRITRVVMEGCGASKEDAKQAAQSIGAVAAFVTLDPVHLATEVMDNVVDVVAEASIES